MTAVSAYTRRTAGARRVLVVEDDEGIRDMLRYNLASAGFAVHEAADGASGLRTARTSSPDLILLARMLTAKDSEVDKIVGLELGADDYITKPFSVREVIARIHSVLRRAQLEPAEPRSTPEVETIGSFTIDRAARRVTVRDREVKLAAREFDLLSHLVAHPNRVHTREALLESVWGPEFNGDRKTVDVHIRWLRQKFAGQVDFEIVTVRGSGYRLDRRPEAAA